mgnify:CR=1 FL=1
MWPDTKINYPKTYMVLFVIVDRQRKYKMTFIDDMRDPLNLIVALTSLFQSEQQSVVHKFIEIVDLYILPCYYPRT